jgi:predicted O-methyltransferase YrrM
MTPKERHRNLEPPSAEFICALAGGCGARRLLEIGGSSGLSTIALAAAARQTGGRLVSIEIERWSSSSSTARRTITCASSGCFKLSPGAVVVTDNVLSHDLREYVEAVRAYPGVESVTLPIGKGLEVSRFVDGSPGQV